MFVQSPLHNLALFLRLAFIVSAITIAVAGCVNDNFSDLQQHIQKVKAKKPPPIPPLPKVKTYETYSYDETTLRDPFQASVERKVVRTNNSKLRPDMNRQREVLEQFPLDTLAMVGSLEQNGERWALIRAQNGTLYRTRKGQYIGQDYGKIIRVTESEIILQETVPDGLGGWVRRQATLSVSESE